jgi:hypothetical protein
MPNRPGPGQIRTITIPRTSASTVSALTKKKHTADLITHLGKQDNHLWNALTSIQGQNNQTVDNIVDIIGAIQQLTTSVSEAISKATNTTVTIEPPALPGGGGTAGGIAKSRGSGNNTKPIPPRVLQA